ncbi:tetratricopeptide repeat protein [Glaciecola sp. 1036]|uniref:tetratricopeptide repeat protein n=1 Tax=Alteromonadaceae TaxID=72275 RepID=UPI003D054F8D
MKLRYLLIIPVVITITGCSLTFWQEDEQDPTNEVLSEIQRAERERLTAGRSERPPLSSLNLVPARNMEEVTITPTKREIPPLSLEQKRDEYEALLPLMRDPEQKRQVAFRLADIRMLLAEQALEKGDSEQQSYFDDAIAGYLKVLNQNEVSEPVPGENLTDEQQRTNIKLMDAMYQLSRAMDLAGQREQSVDVAKEFLATFSTTSFAISEKHVELYFRIGEHYFAQQDFSQAINYYSQVLENSPASSKSNFYSISAYMLGWSYFKLDDYDNALIGFNKMLAHSLPNLPDIDSTTLDNLALTKGNLRLVKDSLRIMALTFSYRGNDQAIQSFYRTQGQQPYEHLVYEELAQQHLDDDRYQDSAAVLLAFAQEYPFHDRSVEFFVRHIDAYILGGFPEKVLTAKRDFVTQYALGNGVVNSLNTPLGQQASPYLQQYLPELAQTEHSIAQGIEKLIAQRQQGQNNNDFAQAFTSQQASEAQLSQWRSVDNDALLALRDEALNNAIEYYQNYVFTYENDLELLAKVAELRFYMAEALLSAKRYQEAIRAFETYAYQDQINPMAVEAAYAAILAYQQMPEDALPDTLSGDPVYSIEQLSQKRFVESFAADRRSPAIALNLMQDLFKQKHYLAAMHWAQWTLEEAVELHQFSTQQTNSSILVMAHSHYALNQYAQAEVFYERILTRLPAQDERVPELTETLAASIYKQGESALLSANLTPAFLATLDLTSFTLSDPQRQALEIAVGHLQRLVKKTPNAEVSIVAQYDDATYNALLGNWHQAINKWKAFEAQYPKHELSANIEPQLLFAYEQVQDWESAARILLGRFYADKKSEQGRLSLFNAAEYFEKANNREMALDSFRRYAHAFPEPMGMANEARFNLSEYYLETNEDANRRYWLNKMMQAQLKLSSSDPSAVGTPRSRYLAAMSAMVFAQDAEIVFERTKLTIPLDRSLHAKQKALQNAIDGYDRVMSFAVAQYTTEANYRLATLYSTLANDLMDSERPDGLSALESEQYEYLLEEQAFPFEETAIQIHEKNIARIQNGIYDDFIKQSFKALSGFLPARYNKPEVTEEVTANEL